MSAQALLIRCREMGVTLTPTPDDALKVRSPAPLPEPLKEALKQHKAEILVFLRQSPPQPEFCANAHEQEDTGWLCPHCGRPATIEDVFPSLDGERTLTMWRCDPCQVVAVTPDTIRQPPSGWMKRTEQ